MMKDGTVWVIETKGGESHGQDKNIFFYFVENNTGFFRFAVV